MNNLQNLLELVEMKNNIEILILESIQDDQEIMKRRAKLGAAAFGAAALGMTGLGFYLRKKQLDGMSQTSGEQLTSKSKFRKKWIAKGCKSANNPTEFKACKEYLQFLKDKEKL